MTGTSGFMLMASASYLPTIHEFRLCSKDPEEDARLEAEYYAENQKVSRMLDEKGFGLRGR